MFNFKQVFHFSSGYLKKFLTMFGYKMPSCSAGCAANCPNVLSQKNQDKNQDKTLDNLFKHIDKNKANYIDDLREAVAIQSVSVWIEKRDEVRKMMHWASEKLEKLGAVTELRELGNQKISDGQDVKLPPVLIGHFPMDENKKTVLIYGHLDVQPAHLSDGWDSDPFVLTEKGGKLYGRGTTDDKGPVLCWFHAIEAYKAIGEELPVNIKFVFEGMEESGSEGLEEFLQAEKNKHLSGIDYICISDNNWLGTDKPCITYGLRGISYFGIHVTCATKDLHSGTYGGKVHEAVPDLVYLLNTLEDENGKILIDNIYREVAAVSPEEEIMYKTIVYDVAANRKMAGAKILAHDENKESLLMHGWRFPSLSIHGIEGAFSEYGTKTVIPCSVIGKFSIRTVPDQNPKQIEEYVRKHLDHHWKLRKSPNEMEVVAYHHGRPWVEDTSHPNYQAGIRATEIVYGVKPDFTRAGGSIPITLTFQEATGKNILLLPIGAGDDGEHSQNEKINIRNYIQGTKLLGAYLYCLK